MESMDILVLGYKFYEVCRRMSCQVLHLMTRAEAYLVESWHWDRADTVADLEFRDVLPNLNYFSGSIYVRDVIAQ